MCVPQGMYGGRRTARRSLYPPSTIWVLGIELRSSGLAASAFTHGAILLAQEFLLSVLGCLAPFIAFSV